MFCYKKLKAIKFLEQSIQWFRSYLCDQTFLIETVSKTFDVETTSCGVPQGSILRPLWFFIYVNHMPQAEKLNLLLYVDDSCLMYQHKDIAEIEQIPNEEFENICEWFVDNKLSIYFCDDKTISILFAYKQSVKNIRRLNIR